MKVGVTQRHLDVGVSERFADGIEVHCRHCEPASECVAQIVPGEVQNFRFE